MENGALFLTHVLKNGAMEDEEMVMSCSVYVE